jgi:Flagellar biosynthesis pathway, component FliQ
VNSSAILDIGATGAHHVCQARGAHPHHVARDRVRHFAVPVDHPDPGGHLSFVPKAVGVSIALLICGNWMISEMVSFTHDLFTKIPMLLGG